MTVLLTIGPVASTLIDAQGDLVVLPAQGSVHVLVGPGGNSAVQIGSEGPLIVDTQPAAMSAQVLEAVRGLSPRPIRHVVLTSGGDQQAGGAATISKAGRYVRVIDSIDPRGLDARASIIAHLNVLNRMSAGNVPSDSWPTDTYFTPEWSIFSNGEAVQLFHVTAATVTATRSSSSADPTSSAPARSSIRPDIRDSIPSAAAALPESSKG